MSLKNSAHVMLVLGSSPAEDVAWGKVVSELSGDSRVSRLSLLSRVRSANSVTPHASLQTTLVPLSLEGLIASPKGLSAIRSLEAFRLDEGYEKFRFVALKLLNRRDFTGTLRFLEREALLASAVSGVLQILDEQTPNLIVFDVTPHEFLQYVVWSIATWQGVTVLFFQPSPIAPAMLARTSLKDFVSPPRARVAGSRVEAAISQVVGERLQFLVNGLDPAYMELQQRRDSTVRSLSHRWTAVMSSLKWLGSERFPESIDLSGHGHRHGFFSRALKVFLVRSLQMTLRSRVNGLGHEGPLPKSYCVFALHYEPERTSLPEGLPIDFQGDAVVAARALMPEDSALVVKEHYSQQTSALRGFLGRSPMFYDLVKSFPNTIFAGTRDRLSELVRDAQCVFTLTGTVAIEAVLRGVPVAYFGSPWWAGLPGTLRLTAGVSFDEVVAQVTPSQEDVFAFFDDLTLNRMIPGIASESVETIEQRLGPLPEGFFDAEAQSIAECIRFLLDGNRASREPGDQA